MPAHRTGTATWKRIRKQAIAQAQDEGQTNCPLCNVPLDYTTPYRPDSAEVDHIVAHARGGTDTLDNSRVICRDCNVRKGDGNSEYEPPFPHSRNW